MLHRASVIFLFGAYFAFVSWMANTSSISWDRPASSVVRQERSNAPQKDRTLKNAQIEDRTRWQNDEKALISQRWDLLSAQGRYEALRMTAVVGKVLTCESRVNPTEPPSLTLWCDGERIWSSAQPLVVASALKVGLRVHVATSLFAHHVMEHEGLPMPIFEILILSIPDHQSSKSDEDESSCEHLTVDDRRRLMDGIMRETLPLLVLCTHRSERHDGNSNHSTGQRAPVVEDGLMSGDSLWAAGPLYGLLSTATPLRFEICPSCRAAEIVSS